MKTLHKVMVATVATVAFAGAAFAASYTGVDIGGGQYEASGSVDVSAVVAPFLTLTVNTTPVAFGNLPLATTTTAGSTTAVSAVSNGTSYSVAATFAPLTDSVTSNTIALKLRSNLVNAGATDITTGQNVLNQASYVAGSTDATVSYLATTDANEQAGTYNSTVYYTATANF